MRDITVIGCGVSGLSSALCLQRAGYRVQIITRDMPQSTTSAAAGAIWHGFGASGRERAWAETTLRRFLKLSSERDSGVTLQRMREFMPHPVGEPWFMHLLPTCERITPDDLPPGMRAGWLMDVPIVAPPLYLRQLKAQFLAAGGRIAQREVGCLRELAQEGALIVNCSGFGARQLAQDPGVYPIRGQTLLMDAPGIAVGYMDEGDVTHIFPRGDGVLIGGVYQVDNQDLTVDADLSADIMRRCARIEAGLAGAAVLRESVGLRPGRASVRLEAEAMPGGGAIIHNYGHAAVGFTLSWGCALEALCLANALAGDRGARAKS